MKKYLLVFLTTTCVTSSVFATSFPNSIYENIKKEKLVKYPIIAYTEKDRPTPSFRFYFKNEGDFTGIKGIGIIILSEKKELVYRGTYTLNKHTDNPNLYSTEFSIQKRFIPFSKIIIAGDLGDKSIKGLNSNFYNYIINLQDIFEIYSDDAISYGMHVLVYHNNDDKLRKFLNQKFYKKRKTKSITNH